MDGSADRLHCSERDYVIHVIHPWCREVCGRLGLARVRYVAVSGTAVVLHGHIRPTLDLDIVISSAPGDVNGAMNTLMRAGFAPSIPLPMSAVTVMRMFDQEQREVDLFVRYAVPFEELWASSVIVQVEDTPVRIMSLDHLLKVKRINGRPHDLMDIDGLLALQRGADGPNA